MLLELKKIASKKNIFVFILFTLFSFYFVYSGVTGFQDFKKEKENFIKYEKLKVKQYINYEQYGCSGFRVISMPSPLNIFFNCYYLDNTVSKIDTSEVLKIYNFNKFKKALKKNTHFSGFLDFLILFGSLFFLILSVNTFKSIKIIHFYKSLKYIIIMIFKRLIIAAIIFLIFYFFVIIAVRLLGVNLSASEYKNFFLLILYTLTLLLFFYFSGLLLSLLTIKHRNLTFIFVFLFWSSLVVFIPGVLDKYIANTSTRIQSIEKTNLEKLRNLMDFEREAKKIVLKMRANDKVDMLKLKRDLVNQYMQGSYLANKKLENERHIELMEMFSLFERVSLITPTTYFDFLSGEVSGEGYYSHLQFLDYIREMRHNFMKFYVKKRRFSKKEDIESFVINLENIFKARSHIPPTFWTAIGINVILILILFLISRRLIIRHLEDNWKMPYDGPFEFHRVKVGDICYVYCGSEQQRDKLFRSLRGDETLFIDQVSPEDFDSNITLKDFFHLAQTIEKTDVERARVYMKKMEIAPETLNKRIEEVPFETFKKFYCAVKFANLQKCLIISDYASGSSKDFNHTFRHLLSYINKIEGKTIVYLSKEMFDILSVYLKYREICENSLYKIFKIDEITAIVL